MGERLVVKRLSSGIMKAGGKKNMATKDEVNSIMVKLPDPKPSGAAENLVVG